MTVLSFTIDRVFATAETNPFVFLSLESGVITHAFSMEKGKLKSFHPKNEFFEFTDKHAFLSQPGTWRNAETVDFPRFHRILSTL